VRDSLKHTFLLGEDVQSFMLAKAGALFLDPHPQTILLWLFWKWGLLSYLPGLALNHDEPPAPEV
jgi:hypothetical protein